MPTITDLIKKQTKVWRYKEKQQQQQQQHGNTHLQVENIYRITLGVSIINLNICVLFAVHFSFAFCFHQEF